MIGKKQERLSRSGLAHSAERRQITSLFVDLVGSTALSEQLDPEEFFTILQGYHRICEEVVASYGGHVAQRFGDGVLAFFGLPQAHENDPERAVHAALAIAATLRDRSFTISEAEPVRLTVRLAVNTGLVVAGKLARSGGPDQLSVFGKSAHVASRLQELAPCYGVLLGQPTYELVRGFFRCRSFGEHPLKGIKQPVSAWLVEEVADQESRFDKHDGPPLTPMVGRMKELATLQGLWEHVLRGAGSVAVVSGEPGIGKSRLLQAFRALLTGVPPEIISLQCSPLHVNTPLAPTMAQIRRAARLQQGEPPAQSVAKLRDFFAGRIPEPELAVSRYGALLSIPAQGDFRPADLGSTRERDQALTIFATIPVVLAQDTPVLVLIEDVHWIDPTSIEVLQRLVAQIRGARVFVVITHRSDYRPGWLTSVNAVTILLSRLEPEQCRQMVTLLAGAIRLPGAALDQIVDRTDGVPLFLEEFTRSVLDAGVFRQDGGRMVLHGALPDPLVPATLQDALMERLDRLGDAKLIAEEASVFGRQFTYHGLRHVSGRGRDQITRLLGQLEATGLLRRQGELPEASFSFKHAMIQEAAYAALVKEERCRLHARAASWARQASTHPDSGELGLIGHHYSRAGMTAEAVDALLSAGRAALRRSACQEAVAHLRQGLGLVAQLPSEKDRIASEIELQLALAMALTARQGWSGPHVDLAYGRALTLCRDHGTLRQRSVALWGVSMSKLVGAQLVEALHHAKEFVVLAEACGNEEVELMAHTAALIANFFLGRLRDGLVSIELIAARYRPSRHANLVQLYQHDPKVMAMVFAGHIYWMLGEPNRGRACCAEGRAYARQLGYPFMTAYSLVLGASDHLYDHDLAASAASIDEGMKLAQEHGLGVYDVFGPLWAIEAMAARRPGLKTVERLAGLVRMLVDNNYYLQAPLYQIGVAQEFARQGAVEPARALVAESLAVMERTGERWFEPDVLRVDAELHCREPDADPAAAAELFRRAIATARAQGAVGWELRAALSFARSLGDGDWQAEAYAAVAEARAKFSQGESSADIREADGYLLASSGWDEGAAAGVESVKVADGRFGGAQPEGTDSRPR